MKVREVSRVASQPGFELLGIYILNVNSKVMVLRIVQYRPLLCYF